MGDIEKTIKIDVMERELSARFTFTFDKGYRGNSMEPPEGPSVAISEIDLTDMDGKRLECPRWLHEMIADSEWIADELIDYASEDA
jgi:hypothetical protein